MEKRGQVLTDIRHGGHVLTDVSARAAKLVRNQEFITRAAGEDVAFETPFDYLFPELAADPAAHLPADQPIKMVEALKALGDAMVEDSLALGEDPLQPTGNSTIPPIFTYWGQFIDHDLTANTDRDSDISDITRICMEPLDPDFVVNNLKNLRQPSVNLDSVYGDGPTLDPCNPTQAGGFYDGIQFRIGRAAETDNAGGPVGGERIPPADDLMRDLPRAEKKAQIADGRNDENLIIAQLHTAFLRFHNKVVEWVRQNESHASEAEQFERARQLVIWHHQWLVVNDYLKTLTLPGVVDKILLGGLRHYRPEREPFMPIEFSVAAYRFGHTMVRAAYDYNRNFGRPGVILPSASFDLLFTFTGGGDNPFFGATDVLPFNWIIEWDRFVDKNSPVPDRFARKIDTRLAPPLAALLNQGNQEPNPEFQAILKRLARRNLLRGYLLSLPTGQSVAQAMGVNPLTAEELRMGNSAPMNQVLADNGFLERTPLWYYVLKEAEVRANGNTLGELGSRIVCETILGQILHDPASYLSQRRGWHPGKGVKLPNGDPIVTISDLLRFAGVLA